MACGPHADVRLSDLDMLIPAVGTNYVYVFRPPPFVDGTQAWHKLCDRMEASLVEHIAAIAPRLTGRIERDAAEAGGRLWFRHIGTAPPLFLRAQLEGWSPSDSDLATGAMASWPRQELLPTDADVGGDWRRILKVKAVWCTATGSERSAVVLTVQILHRAMDAAGAITLVNTWAAHFAGRHADAAKVHTCLRVLDGCAPPRPQCAAHAADAGAWVSVPVPEDRTPFRTAAPGAVVARYHFTARIVEELRQRCAADGGVRFSTNSLVLGCAWSAYYATHPAGLDYTEPAAMLIPVNYRGRYVASDGASVLPADYLANGVLAVAARAATLAELAPSCDAPDDAAVWDAVRCAARHVHDTVATRATSEYLANVLDARRAEDALCAGAWTAATAGARHAAIISSWVHFPAMACDFGEHGLGAPLFFAPAQTGAAAASGFIVHPTPSRSDGGGVDLLFTFASREHAAAFGEYRGMPAVHVGDMLVAA